MQANNTPTKIPVPFADSGTKNTIPIPSQVGVTAGAASFTTGFPPLTFTPIAAGGVPPFGADFNGVLNAITQALRWTNAGGQYVYDATFSTSIGGYPKGSLLQRSTLDGFWLSTADNNTTDPDAGGAGWVDPLAGRLLNIQRFTTAGTATYTPTTGTKQIAVVVVGGGGGGGGCAAAGSSSMTAAGGGGSGSYFESTLFAVPGSPVTVTVGAGGAGGIGSNNGSNGGTSSFGALISCLGGFAGGAGASGTGSTQGGGIVSLPTASVNAVVNSPGMPGGAGFSLFSGTANLSIGVGGTGGSTPYGQGSGPLISSGNGGNPLSGVGNVGGGGGGAAARAGNPAANGGAGAPGAVYVFEYS